jgi:hypothetical protein
VSVSKVRFMGSKARKLGIGAATALVMLFPAALGGQSQSPRLERVAESNLEREFAAAMSKVAALRETDKSMGIGVTDLFKQITDTHSLSEFRDFLAARYKFERTRDVAGNGEYTDIEGLALKRFDRRFPLNNMVRIVFDYDSEWKNIIGFSADLSGGEYP